MSIGRSFFVYAATIVGVALFSFQPQAVKAQEYGGTFIKAVATEPSTLDHVFGFDFSAQTVMTNIYNPLIRLDYSFVPHPELAESWKISDDGFWELDAAGALGRRGVGRARGWPTLRGGRRLRRHRHILHRRLRRPNSNYLYHHK